MLKKIKKGDIVGRKSYGKDIIFVVDRIIEIDTNSKLAILKGLTIRVKADSYVEDLEVIDKKIIRNQISLIENKMENRIKRYFESTKLLKNINTKTGKILHLDGDQRYSEKSYKYYRNVGLDAIVKNVAEYKQPKYVRMLLEKYKPNILVITGHDRYDKKEYQV